MPISTTAFGTYDIRGIYPDTLSEELAYRIGRAFPGIFGARRVAVGHDIRLSGPSLQEALVRGLTESGCDVVDIGMCGTEMIYFAVGQYYLDGGIMITASHNPKEYNGMKFVREGARPISNDNGLVELREAVEMWGSEGVTGATTLSVACGDSSPRGGAKGGVEHRDITDEYVQYILSYVDMSQLRPYRIVCNTGNGAAGPILRAMERFLPLDIVMVNEVPDGAFPNGVPNPLLPENREATARVVRETGADMGVAWDGDFDRCFVFDENGTCIEGYYLVGFLAQAFLAKHPGERIIHDPRLTWNTREVVTAYGGEPVLSRSGHAFIKAKMREENAIYGGEMSSHHYFRDFWYCDSGMIPWLLVVEFLSQSGGKSLSQLMKERMERFPISGEINSKVKDADDVLARVEERYGREGEVTRVDGLSIAFPTWRFSLRRSNTEPVIRLNVETRGDRALCEEKTQELLAIIRA